MNKTLALSLVFAAGAMTMPVQAQLLGNAGGALGGVLNGSTGGSGSAGGSLGAVGNATGSALGQNGSLVGAIGVSGAPGGDADAACAKAGIDAIREKLDF